MGHRPRLLHNSPLLLLLRILLYHRPTNNLLPALTPTTHKPFHPTSKRTNHPPSIPILQHTMGTLHHRQLRGSQGGRIQVGDWWFGVGVYVDGGTDWGDGDV